MVLVHSVVDSE